jgi:hypothetical protein
MQMTYHCAKSNHSSYIFESIPRLGLPLLQGTPLYNSWRAFWPLRSFHPFCFFSFLAFISAHPSSSSSSSCASADLRPAGLTEVRPLGPLGFWDRSNCDQGRIDVEVNVDARRVVWGSISGAIETGRYLDAKPTLLLSEGAIDAA